MSLPSHALQAAAGTLQRISETTPGERGRRASVVVLVLRSVQASAEKWESGVFLRRRAEVEVDRLAPGAERVLLERLLAEAGGGSGRLEGVLTEYAAGLETGRRLAEADAVMGLARSLEPERAELALRAGRLARLQGDRQRALDLYRAASELDLGDGSIARLAAIGEAVVAEDAERALSAAVRDAIRAGDAEAAAVGLEERARLRRSRGDRPGARRDLGIAAARYNDPVDRARVAHQIADLFVAGNDPHAAREVLLFALSCGDRSQRDHARARLHTVSRDIDDQLGMRRWRSFQPPTIVSLSARSVVVAGESAAPAVVRWRARIEG